MDVSNPMRLSLELTATLIADVAMTATRTNSGVASGFLSA